MLKFYLSLRLVQIEQRYLIIPDHQLNNGFKGLDFEFKQIAYDRRSDGRALYEFVLGRSSEYSFEECLEYKDIIIEGLAMWSAHEKSLESAKALAEKLAGGEWEIDGDSLVSPFQLD